MSTYHLLSALIVSSLILGCLSSAGSRIRLAIDPVAFSGSPAVPEPFYNWQESFYPNMPVDHFSFADSRTFQLR